MEIQQLTYFCSVARLGSFTKAANSEGVAQPTLSLHIRRLEKSVGVKLFVRLARSVKLTHAGETLYSHANEMLSSLKQVRTQLRQLAHEIGGPLRVGVIPTVLPYMIASHIQEFITAHPQVEISLLEDLSDSLIEKLKAGDLDIIITSFPLKQPELICSELLREELVVVASKMHSQSIPPGEAIDFSKERFLCLKKGHCFRDSMLAARKTSIAEAAPIFESDHFDSLFRLVASGVGVTIAPKMASRHATNCEIFPLEKEHFRRIGYARLRTDSDFNARIAFTKWLRAISTR